MLGAVRASAAPASQEHASSNQHLSRKTQKIPLRTRRSFARGMPRGLFGRSDLMAHSKSASSYRMIRGPGWALESRPNRCLQPAKPGQPHFRDLPLTGRGADMPKSTRMTRSGTGRISASIDLSACGLDRFRPFLDFAPSHIAVGQGGCQAAPVSYMLF